MNGPLAILCSGQGTQHPGMFDLVAEAPEAQPVFAAARDLLEGRVDPRQLVREADQAVVFSNRVGQILCCTQGLAAWAALHRRLAGQIVVAGYSVGELTAWGCAGLLETRELLRLAAERAEAMDAATIDGCGLAAVRGLTRPRLEPLCRAYGVHVAIINGADNFVLGGTRNALESVCEEATKAGATRTTMLRVAVPSHTPLLIEASRRFSQILEHARFAGSPARGARLLAGMDGDPVFDLRDGARKLASQISHTVNWAACLDACRAAGVSCALELGPGRALAAMARDALPDAQVRSIEDFRTLAGVLAWLERA
ncbi:MAG: acyltransferase domain-containing protein [Verrucomicrobia bacterium]|nr:acyltransferase domain-containing protein [Verrucomicrobiota bacterium]